MRQRDGRLLVLVGLALFTLTVGSLLIRPTQAHPARRVPLVPFQPGDVFAGVGGGLVNHYSPTGTFIQTLVTGSPAQHETGMCFDAPGNLYTTNWDAGSMSKFNNLGVRLQYPWGGPFSDYPESCVADAQGNIYTGEVDGFGTSRLRKFDANGTFLASYNLQVELRDIDWVDLAADQCTIYYTSEGSSIKRFNVCTNTQLPNFATNLPGIECYALRLRSNNEVMVACYNRALRLDANGVVIQTYPTSNYPGAFQFFAANLDPDRIHFWTGDFNNGNIYKINISTGALALQFNAPPVQGSMAGLAIYGEYTQGLPTPTPAPPSPIPSDTPTPTGTPTPTDTPTLTPTVPPDTPTPTFTNTPTWTPTPTPTATPTFTPSWTPTAPPVPGTPTPSPTPCTIQFTDVDINNPFYTYIRCLACRNIISGYADGTFRWQNDVTRAQVSKMVANSAGFQDGINSTQQTFTDVPASAPFWIFIERLARRGLISGYDCGAPGEPCDPAQRPYFRPNNAVTRGQLAKIDAGAVGYADPIPSGQQTFADVPPGSAFWRWIEQVYLHGVISGYGCGGPGEPCDPQARPYFRPYATATRGQTSKIVANTFFPNCVTPAGGEQ